MSVEEFLGGVRVLQPSDENLRDPPPLWMFLTPSLISLTSYISKSIVRLSVSNPVLTNFIVSDSSENLGMGHNLNFETKNPIVLGFKIETKNETFVFFFY